MIKSIAIAGAAAALVIGSMAVAQTMNNNANGSPAQGPPDQYGSTTPGATDSSRDGAASNRSGYDANASTSAGAASTRAAGERG